MKILAVSDQVIDRLYSSAVTANYPDVKMLIGCGDLPYNYLEFLVSVFNVPMYYVPGNHDPEYGLSAASRAEGGTNLDGQVIYAKNLLMAGLGGSVLYSPGGPNQYSQLEMYLHAYRLTLNHPKNRRELTITATLPPDWLSPVAAPIPD